MDEIEKNNGEIIIYRTEDGRTQLEVRLENENVWLSQQQMSKLFQTSRTNIVEHIKHIFEEGELEENSTCQIFRQVRIEGTRKVERSIPFYNLEECIVDFFLRIIRNSYLAILTNLGIRDGTVCISHAAHGSNLYDLCNSIGNRIVGILRYLFHCAQVSI